MAHAYVVGVLDKTTGEFLGADWFSDSQPTMGGNRFSFVMLEVADTSLCFGDLVEKTVREEFVKPYWHWLRDIILRSRRP